MIATLLPFLHLTTHNEQAHKITLSVVDTPIDHFPCHHGTGGLYETCTKRLELRNSPQCGFWCRPRISVWCIDEHLLLRRRIRIPQLSPLTICRGRIHHKGLRHLPTFLRLEVSYPRPPSDSNRKHQVPHTVRTETVHSYSKYYQEEFPFRQK